MNSHNTDGHLAKKTAPQKLFTKQTNALNTDGHLAKKAPHRELYTNLIAPNAASHLAKAYRKLQHASAITVDAGGRAHIVVKLAFTSTELKVEAEMSLFRSNVPVSLSFGSSIVDANKTQRVLKTPRHHRFSSQIRSTKHDPRQLEPAPREGPNPRKHSLTDSDVAAVEQKPETQRQIGRRGMRREMEEEDRKSLQRRTVKKNLQMAYSQSAIALVPDNIRHRLGPRRDAGSVGRPVASNLNGVVLAEHKLLILSEDIFN